MTPLAVFLRSLARTCAVCLGAAVVLLQPPARDFAAPSIPSAGAAGSVRQQTISELSAQLEASDPAIRARAACELREHADRAGAAIDALIALLPDAAPLERSVCGENWWKWNPENKTTPGEQAAAVLVSIGSRAFDPLVKTLKHQAWIARRNAAWALGALDDGRAVEALIPVMKDAEPAVREQAAWALGALDDVRALPAVIDGLRDSDPRVRRQSAWAAGAIDDRGAVDPLLSVLRDRDRTVREQAAWALGAIGDSRAMNALLPVLKDPEPAVRRQAAWAIGVLAR
ncbi:MAG: HEAT repeat domain-containing protein [Acidobacteriota bacterium]|nr:HEAT repeat domain-containing protein [Acidobacteriota bacterium]